VIAALVFALRQMALIAAIVIAVFLLVRVIPGDVVDVLALQGDLDDDQQAEMRRALGLDAGWPVQLWIWLRSALQGDLGVSLRFGQPVAEMVMVAIPQTLWFALASLGCGLALGLSLAIAAVIWPRSLAASLVEILNLWSIAVPTFCVGLAAILIFAIWLRWMPVLGAAIAPIAILAIDNAGQLVKPLHEDLRESSSSTHVRTALAKGLPRWRIVVFHMLPGALSVAIAMSGIILAGMIGGTLTMEALFGLPGIGRLALDSVRGRDYPLIQAVILVIALGIVAANLLADLAQRLLDPRLR
jgi:peptide/nickel transport system permease protein